MSDIFVHIVTWNSAGCIEACVRSLKSQTVPVSIYATDNCSYDSTVRLLEESGIHVHCNAHNYGFAAAHNQGVKKFLESSARYLLILNPDTILKSDALAQLISGISKDARYGLATPKLLRMDEKTIDAAGMYLNASLRHFDRGSGEQDSGQYDKPGKVFGGTGACLLIKRECVEQLLLSPTHHTELKKIYPQIPVNQGERRELFDENFFAYREDADLCWRAQTLGWDCFYCPRAVALHGRVVTPERRSELPAMLNMLGVQNRFLLQLNNFSLCSSAKALFEGFIIRNLVVLGGLILERTSLAALPRALTLMPRALAHRKEIKARATRSPKQVMKWLSTTLEEL